MSVKKSIIFNFSQKIDDICVYMCLCVCCFVECTAGLKILYILYGIVFIEVRSSICIDPY